MKKQITLLFIALLLAGCSKEDKDDCDCNAKYLNANGSGYYYVPNQPIDCDTKQPTRVAGGGFFVGCN